MQLYKKFEGNFEEVVALTPAQRKLFTRLKNAYKACVKGGIYFANCYGELTPYNSKYVAKYGDYSDDNLGACGIELECDTGGEDSFLIANQWTDDSHVLGLTEAGMKKFLEDNEEY